MIRKREVLEEESTGRGEIPFPVFLCSRKKMKTMPFVVPCDTKRGSCPSDTCSTKTKIVDLFGSEVYKVLISLLVQVEQKPVARSKLPIRIIFF